MDYINEEKIIEEVKKLMAIPKVNGVMFHWLEEMKIKFQHEIKQYNELENIIEQRENQTDEKNNSLKTVEFELVKERKRCNVIPENEVPGYIIDHIINLDIDTGQSHMERFNHEKGKSIDLVVTRHFTNYYTGSIKETITTSIEKHPGKNQHQHLDDIIPLGWEKKEEIKTILKYLLTHEIFYDFVRKVFRGKWKSYLDGEILQINDSGRESIISG